jgi:hypothetical protein
MPVSAGEDMNQTVLEGFQVRWMTGYVQANPFFMTYFDMVFILNELLR